ncbi:hypothetical protein J437_LFUL005965 [Ladona fulva]|uniref:Uncharacterized protein n=1 Tax=Ladona fulva TaxID=123851 RepID=A0A8K0K1H8_LADFU|nr:hypothetical protein J437_LFUL005965 [Ladona fulva]
MTMSGSRRSRIRGEDRAPRSHHRQHQHHVQRLRNPWVGRESTSSSSGHLAKELPLTHTAPVIQPTFYGIPHVLATASQLPPHIPIQAVPVEESIGSHTNQGKEEGGSQDSPGGWSRGGCGGRCPALDDLCFHCLHVAFIAGLIIGLALVVTGAVMHQRFQVLIYIGGLAAAVSLILLGVHCCVQRDHEKRRQRLQRQARSRAEEEEGIPLREMSSAQPVAYRGLVLTPPPPPPAFRSTVTAELATDGFETEETTFHHGLSLWRQRERNMQE